MPLPPDIKKIIFFAAPILMLLLGTIAGCDRPSVYTGPGVAEGTAPPSAIKAPSALPPSVWLGKETFLFQPGDLPDGVHAVQFTNTFPQDLSLKLGGTPDGYASTAFTPPGSTEPDYGNVVLYHYNDSSLLANARAYLVQAETLGRSTEPQSGLGDNAMLYLPAQTGEATGMVFQACHSIVVINLESSDISAVLLLYAERLSARLMLLDCQGISYIPLLPMRVTMVPTPPASQSSLSQGFTPTVLRLPDPAGTNTIRAFAFSDPAHGWLALGASIQATTDGGQTWHPQTIADSVVQQISSQSSRSIWIRTDKDTLVTQDGGASWNVQATPPEAASPRMKRPATQTLPTGDEAYSFCPKGGPNGAGVFASINTLIGWAFCTGAPDAHFMGTELYQTLDGGKNWNLVNGQPPYGRYGASNLFFLDDQHGWLAAEDAGLFMTSDGGVSWRQVASLPTLPGAAGSIQSVSFLSFQTGFVIGSQLDYNQGRDVLLGTQDGGKTWRELFDAPAPSPWPDGPFQVAPDGRGVGWMNTTGGSELQDTLLFTTDWGKTWTAQGTLLRASSCERGYQSVTSLSAPDLDHLWVTLDCAGYPSASVLSSQDGGKSWKENRVPGNFSDSWVDVTFPAVQTGFLVSQAGYLYRTTDGGAAFSLADPLAVHTRSLRYVDMGTQSAGADLRGWEVRGTTLYEADGMAVPFPFPVLYFAYLPDNSGWLVSAGTTTDTAASARRLFSTSDGGKSWVEHAFGDLPANVSSPGSDSIQFADPAHGWLRAGTAFFLTADGGKTWTQSH